MTTIKNKFLGIKNKFLDLKSSDKLGVLIFSISVILLIFVVFSLNQYVWDDEAFALNLVSYSYNQMINGIIMDVHPPFYYVLLKIILDISFFLNLGFNQIIVAKIVSLIPIILLLIFNLFVIRKEFGWLTAGLFSLCLIAMPKMLLYGIQIRMYSWALLFVTLTFYFAYKTTQKNVSKKTWGFLIVFSLLGAYTHYFALINTVVIYLGLLIYFLFKNKREIKKLFLAGIATVVGYLPWLPIFIYQSNAHHASHSYPLLLNELPNFLWFIFSPDIYRTFGSFSLIGLLLIISYFVLILLFFIDFKQYKHKFLYLGPFIVIGTIILTFFLSKSNFAARYIFTSLGVFWLSFSLLLSKNFSKKKIFIPIFIILIISSGLTLNGFFNQQTEHTESFAAVNSIFNEIKSDDLLVFTNIDVYVSFNKPYLKNHDNLYYNIDHNFYEKKLINRGDYAYSGFMTTKLDKLNVTYEKHQSHGLNLIKNALNENKTVWIFTRNTKEEVIDEIIEKLPDGYILEEKLVLSEKYPDEALSYPKRIFIISRK